MKFLGINTLIIILLCLISCQDNEIYTPKPKGYFRINIQDTGYQTLSADFPYSFEYSQHAFIDSYPYQQNDSTKYWINVVYPNLNAILHISYKTFNNENLLNSMINDSRTLVFKQIKKVDDIVESNIVDNQSFVFGKMYQAIGQEASCPYQLWLTDRKKHFFRLSLYFDCESNNDSLQPAIDYIAKDINHLIETFQWR